MTKPAGSLAPVTMAHELGKWTAGLSSADLDHLSGLAADINKTVEGTVTQVARAKIKLGKLLLEARSLFPNDTHFGKWRKENTHIGSKQEAHYCMQVADKFGNAKELIEATSFTVMKELVSAPAAYVDKVVEQVKETGQGPTANEVRADKAKLNSPPKGPPTPTTPLVHPTVTDRALVAEPFQRRYNYILKAMDGPRPRIELAYILFGLDPDPQCPINPESLDYIRLGLLDDCALEEERTQLVWAYETIYRDIEEFDD